MVVETLLNLDVSAGVTDRVSQFAVRIQIEGGHRLPDLLRLTLCNIPGTGDPQ